ncbi:hypothetical protein IQ287_33270 [Burkholderia sp. R-69927]|nr:hypothetical protein [Burkholderia sp. R-70006]MBK5059587.1 hypothetical protein [Burkholderia sp. R-70199]MBK5090828.1 hypothetical protein [Burkholderia sp. R-69927]MBK5165026.1 hypothetical protein [Burkholderia sp. R-70211]MBK5182328.1 hypothetical protein [Burkholderia sp. R-69749]MCI0151538.1 hypothetical protein [Paraburkholderia sediminicola]
MEPTATDTLYRLAGVLRIAEPPLRERGEDIEALAYHMLEKCRSDATHQIRGFSDEAIKTMCAHSWPGNVRELVNRVRRAAGHYTRLATLRSPRRRFIG